MRYGICKLSVVPMRKEASHTSELVSELLFNDIYKIIDENEDWLKIQCMYDLYEGWIRKLQHDEISDIELKDYISKDKYIVNVGRSNCIDQKALYEVLSEGYMAGAAIDTWDSKPKNMNERLIPYEYPFETLDNIVLSPHQAMQVEDGHMRYVFDIILKVIAYITDGSLTDVVDLKKGY